MIVSNPPYVDPDLKLQPELGFEPKQALYSEQRGLADINKIIGGSLPYLASNSKMILEFGSEQSMKIKELSERFTPLFVKDLSGQIRVVVLS